MMKKAIITAVAVLQILICFAGCSSGENAGLYQKGLEVSKIMEEMVDSESYANIMGAPNMLEEKRSQAAQVELSEPVCTYELILPDKDELVVKSGMADISDWAKLSRPLKEQIGNRVSFQTFASIINASMGSETLAFCSLYTAIIKDESIKCSSPVTYLYVFDIDTAVAVTFGDGSATGCFLFAKDMYSTKGLDELFEPVGIEYKNIK